jgi:hypothetical protein
MEGGVLGLANKNGSILINKEITNPKQIEETIAHEKIHLDQMKRGDLTYTDNDVIWKGKMYSRATMKEGCRKLPWEVEAYKKQ